MLTFCLISKKCKIVIVLKVVLNMSINNFFWRILLSSACSPCASTSVVAGAVATCKESVVSLAEKTIELVKNNIAVKMEMGFLKIIITIILMFPKNFCKSTILINIPSFLNTYFLKNYRFFIPLSFFV